MIKSINPFNQETLETFETYRDQDLEKILSNHEGNFKREKANSYNRRAERMMEAANILDRRKDEFARQITLEMGKLYKESLAEIEKCAWVCRYYAEHAESFLADEEIETDAKQSLVCYRPMGNVLAVMPWNFPFWQVFRFAAPTLMAGNTGLLKHASNVSRCALMIEQIFLEAGFPKGSFTTLLIESKRVAELIADPRIQAVTLTGSGPAGKAVASTAAKHIKKSVLELGGSDPYLILRDADLEEAARICAQGRMLNAGQSCIGAKRFIVEAPVFDTFIDAFKAQIQSYRSGDPMNESTTLAPLAKPEFCADLHEQVLQSAKHGYSIVCGGKRYLDTDDAFYPGTILVGTEKDAPAYRDELFGPVAAVIKVADEYEACQVANDTIFGLGAAIFTTDEDRGLRLAKDHIDAGCCFVNAAVKSDPRLPFGGIKESGFGRELSRHGIREFVNAKTVFLA